MNDIPVPAKAIGHVGMVALLKRVKESETGRVVVLREPAGWVTSLVGSERPVFAWLAMTLGEPMVMNAKPARDIYVADACLIPMSSVSESEIEALVRTQTRQDFDDAKDDLVRCLNAEDMDEAEFEEFLEKAARQIFIEKALEIVATSVALREIGFKQTQADGETLRWTGIHEGREIRIEAGPDPFGVWDLSAVCVTKREAMFDQARLPPEVPRGFVFQRVLKFWRMAFKNAPDPDCLQLGAMYEEHLKAMRKANPGPPMLYADGKVFRMTVRWLRERHVYFGEPKELRLSYADNLLRLEIDGVVYGCPARGSWMDDCTIKLDDLLAMPTGTLGRGVVSIGRVDQGLIVRGCPLLIV